MTRFAKHRRPGLASTAVSLAVLTLMGPAWGQASEPAATRIEITGSAIRKISDEGALPVSTFKPEELAARGQTEMKDFMLELPQANSLGTFAGTAGPMTSLRGFGPMRSLTLLNGRRLAKEPLTNQYVSVSVMPQMALERTDILRDGASSIYGSDAIAGVQAFYTKNTFRGANLKAEILEPEESGGGGQKSLGAIVGIGNLGSDGWNVYGALDVLSRPILMRSDRPELIAGSALNPVGIGTTPGLGANSLPANFTDPTNPVSAQRTIRYNPYFSSGCLAPHSVPSTASGRQTCFLDAENNYRPFGNGNDIITLFGKGTMRLGADHQAFIEYNFGRYTVEQANDPIPATVRLTSTHPYYPGNGIVPTVPGVILAGRPIDALWAVGELGPRFREDQHTNQRVVVGAEGRVMGWDYRTGINYGWSERETSAGSGWTSVTGVASVQGTATTLYLDPALNPFGYQTAAGAALLASRSIDGQVFRLHKATNASLDATFSRDVMKLEGGAMALAIGAELRRDGWEAIGLASNDPKASLNNQIDILGGDNQAAGARSSSSNSINRNITSLFAEIEAPLTKKFSVSASLRADHYDDLGDTTVNPKISARYEAAKGVVLRGSANTGFRAPSLPELYTKETERTAIPVFDDPTLCPTVGGVETPAAGYTPEQVCNLTGRFQITKVPSNSKVTPETSKSFTFGVALEPMRNLVITVDYWKTQIDDVIGNRNIDFILANPTLYPDLYLRNADGTLATDSVFNVPSNVGSLRGDGIDLSVAFSAPVDGIGKVSANLDGAYILNWEAKSEGVNGGNWLSALAQYNDVVPVNPNAGLSNATRGFNNRWRHTASVAWSNAAWAVQLSQRFQSKIRDQNSAGRTGAGTSGPRDVDSYENYNLTSYYSGIKNVRLGFAVLNLTDVNPPMTNHTGYQGYLTSSVDVVGRAYRVTAEYKF